MRKEVTVVNISQLNSRHKSENDRYEYIKHDVVAHGDEAQVCTAVYEIMPGKSNYPMHYHTANTEVFYILSGKGMLFYGSGESREVTQGDFIVCPPSAETAHKLTNTSDSENLVYIDFDTAVSPDVIFYPDADKYGIISTGEKSRFFFTKDEAGYYDGE